VRFSAPVQVSRAILPEAPKWRWVASRRVQVVVLVLTLVAALFGLVNIAQRPAILRLQFMQALLVELNSTLVPIHFALQFQTALLHRADLVFQVGHAFTKLSDFVLAPQHVLGACFDFVPQLFSRCLALTDFTLEQIKMVTRELGVQVLEFRGQFLTAQLEFTERDSFRLIGIQQPLTLPFEALTSLLQLSLLSPEGGHVVLFRLCPRQVELRQDGRILK
jgi:hypothetical protein